TAAAVVIQGVGRPRQHGNENIGAAIVVIVLKDNAHPGKTFAVGSETCSGFESAFLKGAIAGVVKQKLLHAVIRDENVRKSVAVVVGERHSQCPFFFGGNPRAFADVLECSITAIVIQDASCGRESSRRTIGVVVSAANLVVVGIPIHVTGHK